MPGFTKSFLFPDINVWVTLTYEGHVHHLVAHDWLAEARHDDVRLFFCRFTQLGLLRLLSADAVMGDEVMNQKDAWDAVLLLARGRAGGVSLTSRQASSAASGR